MLKILFAGMMRYEYEADAALSFEWASFLPALREYPNTQVTTFAFDRLLEVGKEQGRRELIEQVQKERPDLLFVFPYTDELDESTLKELKKYTRTLAWFADDHWRFKNYSKLLAPHFDIVTTTYSKAVDQYKRSGISNVIHTQWAANTKLFRPIPASSGELVPDVSLIGMRNAPRKKVVDSLAKEGFDVLVRGKGWAGGRVSEDEMIKIFATSKINLGLNDGLGYLNSNSLGRLLFRRSMNRIVLDLHVIRNAQSYIDRGIKQIKARIFEIPACGGFLLTSHADNLEDYYIPWKEIVLYTNTRDLIEKTKYYLKHDDERVAIAKAGYERTIREHTYEQRFRNIFNKIGLEK